MKTVALFLALLRLLACSGCMAFGAGIGAAVPRYAPAEDARVGDEVRVFETDGAQASGKVSSSDADGVAVQDGDRPLVLVPREQVAHLKKRVGSYAATGFAIGAAVDGAVVLTVAVLAMLASGLGAGFGAMGAM